MSQAETVNETAFATIEEAIEDIRQGKFVVVVDAADRENEGDLTIAAQFATPEAVNFMATHARGLICLCLTEERCDALGLKPMTYNNETPYETAFTISIEAREGLRRASRRPTARARSRWRSTRRRGRRRSCSRGTCFPCGRGRAACCRGPGRPRLPSTSRGWRG